MEKLAKWAMLDSSDTKSLENDIKDVLKMAEILKNIDTEECVMPQEGNLREDETAESVNRDEMISNAPLVEDGYIIVPKVVG